MPAVHTLPPRHRPLSRHRRRLGFGIAVLGLPALTAAQIPLRESLSLPSHLLLFLLLVVLVALVGGLWPAVVGAVGAAALLNWYFTPPYGTLDVADGDDVLALLVFVLVALAVAAGVEIAAASDARAARSEAEARLTAELATSAPREADLDDVLRDLLVRMVATLGLVDAAVERRAADHTWAPLATVAAEAEPTAAPGDVRTVPVPHHPDVRLRLVGAPLFAEDQRVVPSFAEAVGRSLDRQRLSEQSAAVERLAAAAELRTALLAGVGHDLRTPLAGVKAAVSSLRQDDVAFTAEERAELHATIEESADTLRRLIDNLLDLSRLEAGAVSVRLEPVPLDAVLAEALRSAGNPPVRWAVPEELPEARADAGLLERVLANLLENAVRHAGGVGLAVTGDADAASVRLAIADAGPGVSEQNRTRMFEPFQRLDDHGRAGGLGLGLAVARGFTDAMGGSVATAETPGGGLTVTVTLPRAVPAARG